MKRLIGLCALLVGLGLASAASAAPTCARDGRVAYLCGPKNVEDMVRGPDGSIIGSGMTSPTVPLGHLYLIDPATRDFEDFPPVAASSDLDPAYRDCPGAPDLSKFAPHGVGIRLGQKGHATLYVVNHGGRQAIEVFDALLTPEYRSIHWIGCAILPDNGSGNGVAPLPDGGFVASVFQTAGDDQAFAKMSDKQITGAVYAWAPGKGWSKLAHSDMSGANGVEVTKDGRYILVNAWPEQKVYRFRVGSDEAPVTVDTPFLPDNVRLLPDGGILVAGQDGDIKRLLAPCGKPRCVAGWWVARLDPETMKLGAPLHVPATDSFGDATSALKVGNQLWIGTYMGDRVAIAPAP